MKRSARSIMLAVAILAAAMFAQACEAADQPRHAKRITAAAELLKDMARENDSESFAETVRTCKAVAIFPALVRGGLGIGGMGGEGIVMVRGQNGKWLGPSYVSLVGGSFGLQIGIEKTGLLLTVINDAGLQVFTGGSSFKLGGDVSIAAGPVGRTAEAATDTRAEASIYSYSMSKGAFAGVAISGSTINVNGDANKAYWGEATDAKTALSREATGDKIKPLVDQLNAMTKLAEKK